MQKMKSVSKILFIIMIALMSLTLAQPHVADAHKLNVFAYLEDSAVVGEAYFNDGSPAKNCEVLVKDQDERVVGKGVTDESGAFCVNVDSLEGKGILVTVNAGMGHLGQTTINGDASALVQSSIHDNNEEDKLIAELREIVHSELEPLRSEMMQLHKELSKSNLSEIIGGIGYIFGLVGVSLWIKERRSRKND